MEARFSERSKIQVIRKKSCPGPNLNRHLPLRQLWFGVVHVETRFASHLLKISAEIKFLLAMWNNCYCSQMRTPIFIAV
jgi:hypothetical protein